MIVFLNGLYSFGQIVDTIPPSIGGFTFNPQPVSSGDSLEITLIATDNISGVDFIAVFFSSPSGSQTFSIQSSSWVQQNDSVYKAKIKMNDWAENGNWYVSNLQATDSANNTFSDFTSANDTITTFQVIYNPLSDKINQTQLDDLIIYPNPASEHIILEVNNKSNFIQILNSSGNLVKQFNPKLSESNIIINVSDLSKGAYILRTELGSNAKFIISK